MLLTEMGFQHVAKNVDEQRMRQIPRGDEYHEKNIHRIRYDQAGVRGAGRRGRTYWYSGSPMCTRFGHFFISSCGYGVRRRGARRSGSQEGATVRLTVRYLLAQGLPSDTCLPRAYRQIPACPCLPASPSPLLGGGPYSQVGVHTARWRSIQPGGGPYSQVEIHTARWGSMQPVGVRVLRYEPCTLTFAST